MTFEFIHNILSEAAAGSVKSVLSIARIVFPLMIVMEAGRAYKVIDRIADCSKKATRMIGLSGEATFPLMVGLIFGLAYGAGVIIQWAREGTLKNRDLYLLSFFLVACHAVIEDTVIFAAIGANGLLLLFTRLPVAILITYILSKKLDPDNLPQSQLQNIKGGASD